MLVRIPPMMLDGLLALNISLSIILTSLVAALTLVPMLSAQLFKLRATSG